MNHKDEFDSLLDEALSEYRDAEPIAGLELRVLERIGTRRKEQPNRWTWWGAVAACAAGLAIVAWLGLRSRPSSADNASSNTAASQHVALQPTEPAPQSENGAPTPSRVTERSHPPAPLRGATLASAESVQSRAPMQQQFPTPTPLTLEERAFIAAARRHPAALRAQATVNQAVEISLIDVKPLSEVEEISGGNQ